MKSYNRLNNMIIDIIMELFRKNSKDDIENLDIQLETNLYDLGLDSLDQVELVIDIENKFDIAIPDDDLDDLNDWKVKDIISYLKEKYDIVDIRQERYDKLDNLNDVIKAKQN